MAAELPENGVTAARARTLKPRDVEDVLVLCIFKERFEATVDAVL
jgi:hypothetical protein